MLVSRSTSQDRSGLSRQRPRQGTLLLIVPEGSKTNKGVMCSICSNQTGGSSSLHARRGARIFLFGHNRRNHNSDVFLRSKTGRRFRPTRLPRSATASCFGVDRIDAPYGVRRELASGERPTGLARPRWERQRHQRSWSASRAGPGGERVT